MVLTGGGGGGGQRSTMAVACQYSPDRLARFKKNKSSGKFDLRDRGHAFNRQSSSISVKKSRPPTQTDSDKVAANTASACHQRKSQWQLAPSGVKSRYEQ